MAPQLIGRKSKHPCILEYDHDELLLNIIGHVWVNVYQWPSERSYGAPVSTRELAGYAKGSGCVYRIKVTLKPRRVFNHIPERCPSNHWNDGTDTCADCGTNLQE